MYENFYFRLKKKTIFHIFPDIAQFLLSVFELAVWQHVVIVSHDSHLVAIRKLKCYCTKLHRIVKQIHIDKGNLHGQWKVVALSQVYKNLRIPSSETEKCNTALYIECRSYAGTRTRTHQPVLVLVLMQ